MKQLFTKAAIVLVGITGLAYAQQDPQFTQWMHNKLIYNPGYAGTSGGICGNIQFRKQWASFDGAPTSINFAGDMRLLPHLGVGLTFINDVIGPMKTNYVRVAGAWVNSWKNKATLGIGIDAGALQKTINSTWITPEPDKLDPRIPGAYELGSNPALNSTTYDVGFGAFFNIPRKFFIGLSSSHLPAQTVGSGNIKYEVTRHYYALVGYNHQLNNWHELGMNVKYKSDMAAGALDINLNYTYNISNDQRIWLGPTYRLGDAAAVMAGWSMNKYSSAGFITPKLGVSYDFVLSKLKGHTSGSIEFLLGVCYTPKPKVETRIENDRFY